MNKILIIVVCAVVVAASASIVIWNVTGRLEAPAPVATGVPKRQHFDLEGGQQMKPRWGEAEGEADGTPEH